MKDIPCELIEDLLALYTDELTSSVTNEIVGEHLKSCEKCNEKYFRMKNPIPETNSKEVKEIDFLKKTKKKTRKKILIWTAVIWLIAVAFVCNLYYFSGRNMNAEFLSYNLIVSGNEMAIEVRSTSENGIQGIEISEQEGIVEVSVRGVQSSLFFGRTKTLRHTSSQEIRQVWIGDRIVWANGELISPLTSKLYSVYNPYIGSMPSNGKIVSALNMGAYTGNFKNELQTSQEPYSWKLIFEKDFSSNRKEALEERLTKYAYILLAEIGNLNEVIYEYIIDGEINTLCITSAEASEFAGVDIKTVAEDVNKLEVLVNKTGLSNIALGDELIETNGQMDDSFRDDTQKVIGFTIINYADDDVYGMGINVESGKTSAHQSMRNADGSAFVDGLNIDFQIIAEDFDSNLEEGVQGKIKLKITDKDGKDYEVQGEGYADLIWGAKYRFFLTGNAKDGYYIGK